MRRLFSRSVGGCLALTLITLPLWLRAAEERAASFVPAVESPYVGDWQGRGSYVAQVFLTADGGVQANVLKKFDLPDDEPMAVLHGQVADGGRVKLTGDAWRAEFGEGHFKASNENESLDLERVIRKSSTLGAAPPAGAVILFDGRSLDAWAKKKGKDWLAEDGAPGWKILPDGVLEVVPESDCIITHRRFGDCKVHVEFRTLGAPSNSGVFLQTRYEVNINETYGRTDGTPNGGLDNCTQRRPRIRATRPPLQWQTLDIEFSAPRFDGEGKKTESARATVLLNGVTLYENQELERPHGAASRLGEADTGPLMLQEHGMPVQFRNIWLVAK